MGSTFGIHNDINFPVDEAIENNRPYVFLNVVQSADGRTEIEGKASGLGTDIDRSVMRTLRSRADAVMIGGATVRAERLSLSLDAQDARPVPRAVILSRSGNLPLESNLVRDNRQSVLVLLSDNADKSVERRLGRLAEIRRVPATESGAIDVANALGILKNEYGIEVLLCEGGPTLIGALISANLADELFVTLAPVLVGADTPKEPGTFLNDRPGDPIGDPIPLRLISSQAAGHELFLRYSIAWRR